MTRWADKVDFNREVNVSPTPVGACKVVGKTVFRLYQPAGIRTKIAFPSLPLQKGSGVYGPLTGN